MDLKKLINQRVTHTKLGDGQIINITKTNVTIMFADEDVQFFSFPNTFKNNVIRFIDINHEDVMASLEEKPEVKEKETVYEEVKEKVIKEDKPEEIKKEIKEEKTIEESLEKTPQDDLKVTEEVKKETIEKVIKKEEPEEVTQEIKEEKTIEESVELDVHEEIIEEKSKLKQKYKFDEFLKEFYYYLENKKLFSYLIVKYVNEKAVYNELKQLVLKIILESLDRETNEEETGFVRLFIAMVAHKHYDGALWPYIEQELEEIYQIKTKAELNKTIRKLITDSNFGGENAVLVHAGVFVNLYKDYFSFMYDVYKLNFDYNLVNSPIKKILTNTFAGLKEKLLKEDGDSFYLKLTNKTYYLAKPTKQALIISPSEMAKVMENFLRHIDLWYHNNKYDKTEGDLHRALKLWLDLESGSISKILSASKPYTNHAIYEMDIESKEISLKFMTIVIRNIGSLDYRKLQISFVEGANKHVLTIDSDYRVYKRIGFYTVDIKKQILTNPLEKHQLIVSYDKKELFILNDELNHDVYIFSAEGKDISMEVKYEGPAYILHEKDKKIKNSKKYPFTNYTVSYINRKKDFKQNQQKINTKKELTSGINGHKLQEIVAKIKNKTYDVYKEIDSFVFESSEQTKDLIISINNHERSLSSLINEENIYNEKTLFEIKFNKLKLSSGLYFLKIKDLNGNLITETNFLYDKKLTLNKELKQAPLTYDFNIESSFKIVNKRKYNYDLSVNHDISFNFKLGKYEVIYLIILDLPRYKYNLDDNWKPLTNLELISKQLILTKDCKNVKVHLNEKEHLDLEVIQTTANYIVYDLSSLQELKNRKNCTVNFTVTFNDSKTKEYKFYVKPKIIDKPTINFNKHGYLELKFDFKCFTPEKWELEVIDPFKGKKTYDLKDKTAIIKDFIPFYSYEINVRDKENIRYGVKMSNLYEQKIFIVDSEGLFGKSFKISTASYLNKESKEVLVELKRTAIKFIRKVTKNDPNIKRTSLDPKNVCYECELYKMARGNSLSLIKSKRKLYCEVLTDRSNPILKIVLEDEQGHKIGVHPKRKILLPKYKSKNTPTQYLVIDLLNNIIK